jgi:hypothetical protein
LRETSRHRSHASRSGPAAAISSPGPSTRSRAGRWERVVELEAQQSFQHLALPAADALRLLKPRGAQRDRPAAEHEPLTVKNARLDRSLTLHRGTKRSQGGIRPDRHASIGIALVTARPSSSSDPIHGERPPLTVAGTAVVSARRLVLRLRASGPPSASRPPSLPYRPVLSRAARLAAGARERRIPPCARATA